MQSQTENLWVYDAVEPGQAGGSTVVTVTAEHISKYAELAQNPDERFRHAGSFDHEASPEAMPTMTLTYAPLLREDIARTNGFVALEQSQTARRQTPFAKCEIRWSGPVVAGDTITATREVLEKYERRGSKFVTFRVAGVNQRGEPVAEYDYTCIFEYAQGQKATSRDRGSARRTPAESTSSASVVSTVRPNEFNNVAVGAQLASLTISESQDVINNKNDFRLAGSPSSSNIHTDEEFAKQNIFGGIVNSGPATMSYVDQMLQKSFPLPAFYRGGRLLMRAIEPFRAGDTVTFQGSITGKGTTDDKKIVECRVNGVNQQGDLVCIADAALVLP